MQAVDALDTETTDSRSYRGCRRFVSEALARFGDTHEYGDHMIAAADDGRVWIGVPDAYLAVMWSVRGLRTLSYIMSVGPLNPLVGRAFRMITGNRHIIASVVGEGCVHCANVA